MRWPIISLGQLCEIAIGKTPARMEQRFWGGDHPWLSISDMNQGRFISTTKETITDAAVKECNCRLVPANTLLLSFKLSIGKVAFNQVPLYTNEAIAALTVRSEGSLFKPYLYWALQYVDLLQYVDTAAKGMTLNKKKLHRIEIPLPPLPEQKRIAAILDKADALRAKRRAALAKLDTLLQATFLDMFGDPVTNPMSWRLRSVNSLCNLVRGSSPRPKADPRFYDGPIPRLMVADLTRDGFFVIPQIDSLTEEGAKRSRYTNSGTVVMAVSGNVGLTGILSIDACIHDGFVAFNQLKENLITSRYLMYCLHLLKQTHDARKDGAIFQNTTTTAIKAMQIPTPPLKLQLEWESFFDSHMNIKRFYLKGSIQTDGLFGSLQQCAFKGGL